jgi:hypothetical protein
VRWKGEKRKRERVKLFSLISKRYMIDKIGRE